MLDQRSKGLLAIHGCGVILALNFLFIVLAVLGVEYTARYQYEFFNFPLYFIGITACGVIFFNFYSILSTGLFQGSRASIFQVTNIQAAVLLLMMFGIIFATKDKAISRIFVGVYLMLSYILLLSLNMVLPGAISRMLFKGGNVRRCLAIGEPAALSNIQEWLAQKQHLGVKVIGLVSPEKQLAEKGPYLGCLSDLPQLVASHEINQLILLETRQSKKWVSQIMDVADGEGCQVLIYNPWAEFFEKPLSSVKDGPHTFFIPREEPLESPFNRVIKRLVDIVISSFVLIVVLPPLWLWVYVRMKKESPGPVFFRQKRTGFNRATFTIVKFRTMHVLNDDETRQVTKDDDRVYRFGQFLRRTSLDEFPQFWNVFKGDMSIVGPRPHLAKHDELFKKVVRDYPQRHFVKPGITGYAQCHGYRGEITDPTLLRQRVQYDLDYVANWSIWLDLEIIARTLWIVLNPPKTAY